MRHRIPFQPGKLLIRVEIYTSPEEAQIASSVMPDRFGNLCAAIRVMTTTGRAVQVGDAYDIGAKPDAIYCKFTFNGPRLSDS